MKNLKKSLQSVNKELNALSKKVEKIIVAVSKLEKPRTVREKTVKKAAVKKPVAKRAIKLTAADTIFAIIKRRKKGVGVAELMKQSDFDQKKTYNVIYKLKKQGKIKSIEKGIYKKA